MKKYLNLSWCLLLVLGFSSCEVEDDEIRDEPVDIGGYAVLADDHISVFDTNEDLSVEFFTAEGVTVESVEILQGGEVIGTATVSGETATFSSSIFGAFEFEDEDGVIHDTGSFPIRIRTTYSNGEVSEDPFSVSVDHAITLGDNPTETTMDSLSTRVLEYEVSTHAATVDDVTLMLKKNEDGTYADSGLGSLSTDGGSVEISETNYETLGLTVGDTLYYKFTASSGSLTDSAESYLAVIPKDFQTSHSAELSSDLTMNQLNLWTGEVTADGDADGEIAFLDPAGFTVINDADISFVPVPDDYFEGADVLSAKELYQAGVTAGTDVTSATNLTQGDTFVYSTTRPVLDEDGEPTGETVTVYGVITVDSVTTTTVDGETVTTLDLSFAEGL